MKEKHLDLSFDSYQVSSVLIVAKVCDLDSFFLFKHNAREPLNKVLTYAYILVSEFTYIVALLKSAVAIAGCAMTS